MSHDDLPVTPPEEDEGAPIPPAPPEDLPEEPASVEDLEPLAAPSEDEAQREDEDLMPPAIIAETPIGGVPRPASAPPPPLDATAPQPDVPPSPAEPQEIAGLPDAAPAPPEPEAAAEPVPDAPAEDLTTPLTGTQPAVLLPDEAAPATPEETPAPPPEPPTMPSRPTEPKPLFSSEALTRPDEWDEELSPELAAVLFGGGMAADEASPEVVPGPETEAPPADVVEAAPAPSAPTPPAPAPAEAVHLTNPADAMRLPIMAQGVTSPAPEIRPEGKVRYVRVEEPYGDKGQRIKEEWDYQGPDRPKLNGRTLRKVKRGEVRFADGSLLWRFERRYTDRSYERRTMRMNGDQTYVEREDEIKAPDRTTGKRTRRRESEAMILAAPPVEASPQRGLLARLFRREEHKDAPRGPQTWRPATPDEARRARRQGGAAF